ncbi:hypothetical protein TrLO_g15407 [Triparma laevis f. longispina]|nr:hypothetical protein TrLO_g15407 [Triparma laevis f. longispina]
MWSAYQPVRGVQTSFLRVAGNKRRTSAQAGYGGYMTKRGQLVRSWKKRYFHLSYGCLEYFEDYTAYETNAKNGAMYDSKRSSGADLDENAPFRPKGGILLVGAEISENTGNEDFQMDIVCADRTLTVRAPDSESMQQWHTQLQLHIDLANEDALAMNDVNDGVVRWVQRISQIAAESEERLLTGGSFQKFCGGMLGSKKHERWFKLSADKTRLLWGTKEGFKESDRSTKGVNVSDFHYVEGGLGSINSSKGVETICLVLGSVSKELCLEAENEECRNNWIADLYAIAYSYSLMKLQESIGQAAAKKMVTPKANLRKAIERNDDMTPTK